jgi:cytoskeleton protein RodZ
MPETQAEAASRTGADLKAARESRGLTVRQVAQELHVADSMIEALERGDYGVVGEPVFVRGHLRNYARALGLPESQVLSGYEQTQNKPAPPPLVTQHAAGSMNPRTREWSLRAASGALLLVLGVAVVWWLSRPSPPAETVSATPSPSVAAAPAPSTAVATVAELAAASPPEQKPTPRPEATAVKPAVVSPPVKTAQAVPHAAHQNRSADTAHVSAPEANAPADAALTHAVFTLSSASWIEVYDSGGKRIYYDLAPAGGSLELSGAGPLQVFLGNAPGVSIQVDGAPFDVASFTRPDNTARFKLGKPGD